MWFIDTEVFKFDWMFVGINPITQEEVVIINDTKAFTEFYNKNKKDIWCGWNVRGYDQYIIKALLCGFNPKDVNDWIIVDKKKGYEFSNLFHKVPLITYDAMPNIPVSLKVMEGFMGKNIHETSVPFDIDRPLTKEELEETVSYCRDDVLNLIDVFILRKNEFESQFALIKEFNLPLSSLGKTQAQLAATILKARRKKLNDEWAIRLPECLQLGKYQEVGNWFLNPDNHDYDAKLTTTIGGVESVIAWGGLHGAIEKFTYECADDEVILDADVGQMYPNIMIHYDLQSRGVGDKNKLPEILETSMRLKREGKKKQREPYKRICNIVYGACGDKFNPMYDALHRNLVCVYGQVLMIDLIDKIEDLITLINENTDGIFFIVKKDKIPELKQRVHDWEIRTGLVMEFEEYKKVYQGDVNNFIYVRENGSYLGKGSYVKELSSLDYDLPIINEAIKAYLLEGVLPEQTIYNCDELIKFQKIVKLSNKYRWVEHENHGGVQRYTNKSYRVFATTNDNYGRLLKCDGVRNPAKFANTPDQCFVDNGDIRGKSVGESSVPLDKEWYVDVTKKRLKEKFGVDI